MLLRSLQEHPGFAATRVSAPSRARRDFVVRRMQSLFAGAVGEVPQNEVGKIRSPPVRARSKAFIEQGLRLAEVVFRFAQMWQYSQAKLGDGSMPRGVL